MVPQKFLARMRDLLSVSEYEAFVAALEEPPVRAFRVNEGKTAAERLLPLLPFVAEPIGFIPNAFYAPLDKVGALPCHHAGMLYMQDPSAICAVAAANVPRGARVIDLCAAPGGKSTQLAAAIGDEGVLVSNEYVTSRCRILTGNVERMGHKNTVVTNLSTEALADFYGPVFDLVVCDAPCSGEGMLRKYEVAGEEWSEENVTLCAARQREILQNAVRLVAPGGRLLYSTCTFSLEENEQNVAWLLDTYPELSLVPVSEAISHVTADGIATKAHPELTLCRRFYPHVERGEGQFLALLERRDGGAAGKLPRSHALPLSRTEQSLFDEFIADTLKTTPTGTPLRLRENLYVAPDIPLPPSGVFAAGVCVGTLQKNRIEPHHQLFSAYGAQFRRQLALTADDERTSPYLRGEEIDCPELENEKNGYVGVLFEGATLGGGKCVSGKLKNHYPKGLRNKN